MSFATGYLQKVTVFIELYEKHDLGYYFALAAGVIFNNSKTLPLNDCYPCALKNNPCNIPDGLR